jgi:hypothetical protein
MQLVIRFAKVSGVPNLRAITGVITSESTAKVAHQARNAKGVQVPPKILHGAHPPCLLCPAVGDGPADLPVLPMPPLTLDPARSRTGQSKPAKLGVPASPPFPPSAAAWIGKLVLRVVPVKAQ